MNSPVTTEELAGVSGETETPAKPSELDKSNSSESTYGSDEFSDRVVEDEVTEEYRWDDSHVDYFPMFFASAQAALLAVAAQFLIPFLLAPQFGVSVGVNYWKGFLPMFGVTENYQNFLTVLKWSSILSATILALFSLSAFVWHRRLQVQAGRLFAWLDIALIGGLLLARSYWLDQVTEPAMWMWIILIVGLVGFMVGSLTVWAEYADRRDAEIAKRKFVSS